MARDEEKEKVIIQHLLLSAGSISEEAFDKTLSQLRYLLMCPTTAGDLCHKGDDESVLSQSFIDEMRQACKKQNFTNWDDTEKMEMTPYNRFRLRLQEKGKCHVDRLYSPLSTNCGFLVSDLYQKGDELESYSIIYGGERSRRFSAARWVGYFTLLEQDKNNEGRRCWMKLSGFFKLTSHIDEESNFIMKSRHHFETDIRFKFGGNYNVESKLIVKQFKKWEEECVKAYEKCDFEVKLKSLRRILPISRKKFDWNVEHHRFINILNIKE
eukprot:CAMPEP_0116057520 /NCGR_PEP_ID=MMETSP0322-20121206/4656_1 /TAXON_ID=163516 /ORGANISM="Leptocylindrus danicus var. apora, Strain B651" /LENGTH=268 /DNA_ID=CAMNT_0003541539 /DNA_START=14 /DNA_END=820 /DNA_ORIENTATION=+